MMEVKNLYNELVKNGIPDWYYSINSDISDSFCIVQYTDINTVFWEVYYSERGNRYNVFRTENENEACVEFLNRVHTSFNKYVAQGGKL